MFCCKKKKKTEVLSSVVFKNYKINVLKLSGPDPSSLRALILLAAGRGRGPEVSGLLVKEP